jgi:hypothetical protein
MGLTKYLNAIGTQLTLAPCYQNFHDVLPPANIMLSVYQSYKKKKGKNCITGFDADK